MKEVVAVIRPEKWQETMDTAQAMGLSECSHIRVMGRANSAGCAICARSTEATTA